MVKSFKTIQRLELAFDYTNKIYDLLEAIEFMPLLDSQDSESEEIIPIDKSK